MKTEYAIVLYFDAETNRILQEIMDEIATSTGNDYMTKNFIPPHITVGDFFTEENNVIEKAEELLQNFYRGKILFNGIGNFSHSVLYIKPEINDYLVNSNMQISKLINNIGYEINKLYDDRWIPHLTVATKLNDEQLEKSLAIANSKIKSFYGYTEKIALVRCNPYREIKYWELNNRRIT